MVNLHRVLHSPHFLLGLLQVPGQLSAFLRQFRVAALQLLDAPRHLELQLALGLQALTQVLFEGLVIRFLELEGEVGQRSELVRLNNAENLLLLRKNCAVPIPFVLAVLDQLSETLRECLEVN